MLYTEESVKANIRNREGRRIFFLGKGDTLTPAARDWLRKEHIEIVNAEKASFGKYRLMGGGYTEEKPEYMTHLNGDVLVRKTHPRIKFRGAVDSLEAVLLDTQLNVRCVLAADLGDILGLVRMIVRCEVLGEKLPELRLCGMTEKEIRERSHRPQDFYGQPHFMPEYTDGVEVVSINRARCKAREAELCALDAFSDRDGNIQRLDIIQALNRVSSMLYILMIRVKSGEFK